MFLDPYDYDMDLEVQKEEAFEDGMEKGFTDGANKKAEESAINLLKLQIATPEQVTQVTGLPLEKVQELAKEIKKQFYVNVLNKEIYFHS